MAYYKTCPYCGAHLDPGEVCDCRDPINMNEDDFAAWLAELDRAVANLTAGRVSA